MKNSKRISKLEKSVAELKEIITRSSLSLTNSTNPDEKIIIRYEDNVFQTVKETTNTTVVEEDLTSISNLN